ncbi:MAG: ABC-2 transporter permease [Clostridiaceae bacterium]|nr:ABC-2 transporter permease [Clostridiaceae bacterium]
MFNLIFKDILIQRKSLLFGVIYVFVLILCFQDTGITMFLTSAIGFSYMMIQSACAYDDKNKSDILLNSLPISRNTIVVSKYVSAFVFSGISIVVYSLLTVIINLLKLPIKVSPITLEGVIGILFAIVLMCGIYFPVYFKIGYIKSKVYNFILIFGILFLTTTLLPAILGDKSKVIIQILTKFFSSQSDLIIAIKMLILIILFFSISCMISLNIYRKREF